MTVDEFLIDAQKRYVTKIAILSNMFKIGYQKVEELECRMRLAGSYINVLSRLAGDYALSDDEIEDIINHLIILLDMRDIQPPVVEDFRAVTVINETIVIIKEIKIPPVRKIYTYSIPTPRPTVTGVEYSTESDSDDVLVTITHNIGKKNATIEVVNQNGDRVYPGIRYTSDNVVVLYFNNASTSYGTITISE